MASDEQIQCAEVYVRNNLPRDFAEVLIDNEGFGPLAHRLTIEIQREGKTPHEVLTDFLERAEDQEDDEVAPLARIAQFTAPAAYVYSRLRF